MNASSSALFRLCFISSSSSSSNDLVPLMDFSCCIGQCSLLRASLLLAHSLAIDSHSLCCCVGLFACLLLLSPLTLSIVSIRSRTLIVVCLLVCSSSLLCLSSISFDSTSQPDRFSKLLFSLLASLARTLIVVCLLVCSCSLLVLCCCVFPPSLSIPSCQSIRFTSRLFFLLLELSLLRVCSSAPSLLYLSYTTLGSVLPIRSVSHAPISSKSRLTLAYSHLFVFVFYLPAPLLVVVVDLCCLHQLILPNQYDPFPRAYFLKLFPSCSLLFVICVCLSTCSISQSRIACFRRLIYCCINLQISCYQSISPRLLPQTRPLAHLFVAMC
jgi:hypothetical protein